MCHLALVHIACRPSHPIQKWEIYYTFGTLERQGRTGVDVDTVPKFQNDPQWTLACWLDTARLIQDVITYTRVQQAGTACGQAYLGLYKKWGYIHTNWESEREFAQATSAADTSPKPPIINLLPLLRWSFFLIFLILVAAIPSPWAISKPLCTSPVYTSSHSIPAHKRPYSIILASNFLPLSHCSTQFSDGLIKHYTPLNPNLSLI